MLFTPSIDDLKAGANNVLHPEFDLEEWAQKLGSTDAISLPTEVDNINGPLDLYLHGWIRRRAAQYVDWGEAVPAHVFVWAIGDSPVSYLTKVGGTPYWSKSEDWPTGDDGRPMDFIGQICFADSMHLVGKLPGDVLLIFWREEHFDYECKWNKIGIHDPIDADEVPGARRSQVFHAYLYESLAYPNARQKDDTADYLLEFDDISADFDLIRQYKATQISSAPYMMGDLPPYASGQCIATLNSIWPNYMGNYPHPFINRAAPIERPTRVEQWMDLEKQFLCIDDVGCIYIVHGSKGTRAIAMSG